MSDVTDHATVHHTAGPALGGEIQAVLGRRLGDLYRPEMTEPMPALILDLLDRLTSVMPSVPDADRAAAEIASPAA